MTLEMIHNAVLVSLRVRNLSTNALLGPLLDLFKLERDEP